MSTVSEHIMNLGTTNMVFKYWNIASATDSLTTPVAQDNYSIIGPVDVSIQLESAYKMKQQYMMDTSEYEMYWRQIRSVARFHSGSVSIKLLGE